MNLHLNKRAIVNKTVQVGIATLISRFLAIFREFLQVSFLGIGGISDAFITAFRIPNFFRHMFAEGALNASFVPIFVRVVKEKREHADGLMSLCFLFLQGILLVLYLFIFFKTDAVMAVIAPGFSSFQTAYAVKFLRIMFPFIFLVSASALFGGALNAVNHFAVPAFGPALWNVFYVMTLGLCLLYQLSPLYLCAGVIIAGTLQLAMTAVAYFMHNFKFGKITADSWYHFKQIILKFIPYLMGVSIVEINLFVGGSIASFLPTGSVSLLYYGSRFMNIPLGVFAVALSNILLPHFSRVVLFAPKRMSFYLLEVLKFVSWVIVPVTLFFAFVSYNLFDTLFLLRKSADPAQLQIAAHILVIYLGGLLFFCINKILMSMLYSLKDTRSTMVVTGLGAGVNVVGDLIGMYFFGVHGIAAAASVAGLVMTVGCIYLLVAKHNIKFYAGSFGMFLVSLCGQVACATGLFLIGFHGVLALASAAGITFFASRVGFWFLSLSLAGLLFLFMMTTKRLFGLKIYFLGK
ncbi:murein biosynthesis integral membrane protein MurJ [Candidatus Babeliales bacterium]|nr:murein biosynthesis integral membrane protein MurJ [Candidatus Babeliales bacterium]